MLNPERIVEEPFIGPEIPMSGITMIGSMNKGARGSILFTVSAIKIGMLMKKMFAKEITRAIRADALSPMFARGAIIQPNIAVYVGIYVECGNWPLIGASISSSTW